MNLKTNTWGLNSFQLKIIAIISMLIDHIGYVFYIQLGEFYPLFRLIGRLAFPIFAFMVVEAFVYTHSKANYAIRLAVFALISEPVFDKAFFGSWISNAESNVFFTLLISFLMLCLVDRALYGDFGSRSIPDWVRGLLAAAVVLAACIISNVMKVDYAVKGVLLVLVFYCFRDDRRAAMIGLCAVFLLVDRLIRLPAVWQGVSTWGMLFQYQMTDGAVLAFMPLSLYNGQKGRGLKWFFYLFYPAHLILLFLLKSRL